MGFGVERDDVVVRVFLDIGEGDGIAMDVSGLVGGGTVGATVGVGVGGYIENQPEDHKTVTATTSSIAPIASFILCLNHDGFWGMGVGLGCSSV